jgi:hypothetical protein
MIYSGAPVQVSNEPVFHNGNQGQLFRRCVETLRAETCAAGNPKMPELAGALEARAPPAPTTLSCSACS